MIRERFRQKLGAANELAIEAVCSHSMPTCSHQVQTAEVRRLVLFKSRSVADDVSEVLDGAM